MSERDDAPMSYRAADEDRAVGGGVAARVQQIVDAAEREAEEMRREIDAQRRAGEDELRQRLVDARRRIEDLTDQRLRQLRDLGDELVVRAERARRDIDDFAAALSQLTHGLDEEGGARERLISLADEESSEDDDRPGARLAPATTPSVDAHTDPPEPEPAPEADVPAQPAEDDVPSEPAGPRLPPIFKPTTTSAAALDGMRSVNAARLVAVEMALAGSTRPDVDRHLRNAFGLADTRELLDDVFGAEA